MLDSGQWEHRVYNNVQERVIFEDLPHAVTLIVDFELDITPDSIITYQVFDMLWLGEQQLAEQPALTGATTAAEFATEISNACSQVLKEYGFRGYISEWYSDDFPLTEFARLQMLLGNDFLTVPLGNLKA